MAVRQEIKEKCPRVELFCHSDHGMVVADFDIDVDDCDDVGPRGGNEACSQTIVLTSRPGFRGG